MVKNTAAPTAKRASKLLGQAAAPLVLKVEGTERDGQIIRVHASKCLVGSAADCQLRLIAADVLPKHCVIYRGESGMVVKSWTRDTRINGSTISEAWLRIGDHLSLGSLSFEVLDDQPSAEPSQPLTHPDQKKTTRSQRRRSHRRIRNLLGIVRQQKSSFSSLQAKLDETQKLVDSLLAREADSTDAVKEIELDLRQQQSESRKQKNQRVRSVVNHVRELVRSNQQLQAELREQLEVKQNHLNEVRHELNTTAAETEAERSQRRLLEADLRETEATVTHLKEQGSELQSRADLLRDRWQSARHNGRSRVKTILAHLRTVRDHLSELDASPAAADEQDAPHLAELRIAYEDALRELQANRDSLKETESELAWTQAELEQRQQQADELTGRIRELEEELTITRKQQAEAAQTLIHLPTPPPESAAQEEELARLQSQLEEQTLQGGELQLQLETLRQQNAELEHDISERLATEEELKQRLDDAQQAAETLRRQLEETQAYAVSTSSHDEEERSAMEHLRSMGILRETTVEEEDIESPCDDSAERYSEPEPIAAEEPIIHSSTGLSSFPNFRFDDDEPAEEPDNSYQPASYQAAASNTPTDHDPHADDKEAIDSYMQNLLQRMRAKQSGTGPPPEEKPTSCPISPVPHVKPEAAEVVTPITHEEFVPSRYAPEQTSDIRKLRELANETAKAAIDSATLNRWEVLCRSKLGVSLLALLAGFALNYMSPNYLSIQFAGACLAYVVTVFWWLQSAVIYQHVKNHRKERLEKRFQDEIITPHGLTANAEHLDQS
ncbi:FHA domain-containing protein [Blastopirellula marina]|uniref:FHA domain-containing protein n=1 Tax=Blastopirellula marina TaxID=124 RepID=A0A2S8F879_9BACT|nr:FHA domain-containing protein [Blastopirellula marina]PQO28361.1 hypothetical protein C5Y98_26065 [Blastopirellula marina]PTL41901.1 hypothetical protein C5Y97_26080 [Blastopirellula marina]